MSISNIESTLKTYDVQYPKLLEQSCFLSYIEGKISDIENRKKQIETTVVYYGKMTHREDKLYLDYNNKLLDAEIKKLKYLEEEKGKLLLILSPHFIEPKSETILENVEPITEVKDKKKKRGGRPPI
jgi:hypothetical protein